MQTGKLIIGVTGNIATGKSAVMRLAQERGALVIDADKIVHHLMDNDANMQAALAVAFGPDIRLADGRINRQKLGEIVFNDPGALHDLEHMVHPSVRIAIANQIQSTEKHIVFVEAIKLLEGPLAEMCHQIWVTRCSRQRQLERLMICRGLEPETAAARIDAQPSQEEKVAQADVVIDTGSWMRDTEAQFDLYWNRLPAPAAAPPVTLRIPTETGLAPPAPTAVTPDPAASQTKEKPQAAPVRLDRPIPQGLKAKLGRKIERPAAPQAANDAVGAVEAAPAGRAQPPPPTAVAPKLSPPSSAPLSATGAEVRRARPSDIPSILLLMQKATQGAVRVKRADMLLALGERSYFIGQVGAEVQAVVGWNIENLVSRVTELYFHPPDVIDNIGTAVLASIEESADSHICEVIVIFLPPDAPAALTQLLAARGYAATAMAKMPATWQDAIRESQPAGASFVIKVLRERVTHPI